MLSPVQQNGVKQMALEYIEIQYLYLSFYLVTLCLTFSIRSILCAFFSVAFDVSMCFVLFSI